VQSPATVKFLICADFHQSLLDIPFAALGTQLAKTGSMPDVSKNARKKSKGWLAVALVLALGGVGSWYWLRSEGSAGAADGAAAESSLALETFVVNLTGSGARAYLRVGITLGLSHPLLRNKSETTPVAQVRDTILSVLATAQPDELTSVEGKRLLKEELLKALQERLPQMGIANVYFTEFLVQT
jgi:flagellar basal body-associated protein FliL